MRILRSAGRDLPQFAQQALCLLDECASVNLFTFLELLSLYCGQKHVVRVMVTATTWLQLRTFCEGARLYVQHSSKKQAPVQHNDHGDVFTVSVPWDDPRGVCFAALVGTSPQEVRRAVSLEDREASSREFGHLYQYPPCCVEAYEDLRVGEDWVHAYLRRSPLDVHGYRVANRLAALFDGATLLPEYYPCTAHCSGTRDLGQGLAAILRRAGLAALCEHLFWSLSQPILVRHGALYRLTDAMLDCERLTFNPASVERVVWQSDPGDDKLLLQANALVAGQQQLQFMAGAEVLAVEPVGRFHNRLLQFAP